MQYHSNPNTSAIYAINHDNHEPCYYHFNIMHASPITNPNHRLPNRTNGLHYADAYLIVCNGFDESGVGLLGHDREYMRGTTKNNHKRCARSDRLDDNQ